MSVPRRVVILPDRGCSPLHFIRCAVPCQPGGWCQEHPGTGERLCWLGAGSTREVAEGLARRVGHEVVDAAGG